MVASIKDGFAIGQNIEQNNSNRFEEFFGDLNK